MSKLVTLDEIEEYEREVLRAHAENRAPILRDPHDVHRENLGNAESHLREKSKTQVTKETTEMRNERKRKARNLKRLQRVIRGTIKTKGAEESAAADHQAEADINRLPTETVNTDKSGHVLGDSVNPTLVVEKNTFDEAETLRNNQANAVPVPERFRNANPPQVIQQSNPITGEAPTPEPGDHAQPYKQVGDNGKAVIPSEKEVPRTAISIPRPEHVIGLAEMKEAEKKQTKVQKAAKSETKRVRESKSGATKQVPVTERQSFQGKVKRPDNSDGMGALPADMPPAVRETKASKVAKKVTDEVRKEAVRDENVRARKQAAAKKTAAKKTTAKKTTARRR